MLKRPTSRSSRNNEAMELNLVPVLDALVTLIAFLLFSMSILNLVTIESPFPTASTEQQKQIIKEKPLQLTVTMKENEVEIWSPFGRIPTKKIPNTPEGFPDARAIHDHLVGVKQNFMKENQVVIVPYALANYEKMILVMDSVRVLEPTDPPLFAKNEVTGVDEPLKVMFPNVVFGNLLGDK